jgi:hypothetical protein
MPRQRMETMALFAESPHAGRPACLAIEPDDHRGALAQMAALAARIAPGPKGPKATERGS